MIFPCGNNRGIAIQDDAHRINGLKHQSMVSLALDHHIHRWRIM